MMRVEKGNGETDEGKGEAGEDKRSRHRSRPMMRVQHAGNDTN